MKKVSKTDIRILLVEDDSSIRNTAKAFLERDGFIVDTCEDGLQGLTQFFDQSYQLVILDIMLPSMNGMEILQEIRQESDVPVLMMTALDDEKNQLNAFAYQADDYITKPFYMNVLVKRVEAILRRIGLLKQEIRIGKSLCLYPGSKKVTYREKDIEVTAKEFDILVLLAQANGGIVTREKMITHLWGYDFEGNERIIDTHIKNLRGKFPCAIIQTIKGVGYRLEDSL